MTPLVGRLLAWWRSRASPRELEAAERRHAEIVARREALERVRDMMARRGHRSSGG